MDNAGLSHLPSKSDFFKKLKKKAHPSSPAYTVKPQISRKALFLDKFKNQFLLNQRNEGQQICKTYFEKEIIITSPPVSTIEASHDQATCLAVSSTFDTSTIDSSTSLTPFFSTPIVPHSPTFDNILNQPINSLFSSQSTDPLVTNKQDKTPTDDEENVFNGTFADIQFDLEEEEVPDNMLLTGKQFKILNRKLNSLLQIQADGGGKNSASSLEVDKLLKRQENCLYDAIQDAERNNEKRVKNQLSTFASNLKELKVVAKELHILFVQDVKIVREYVNLKKLLVRRLSRCLWMKLRVFQT
ncbi:unnamed protein product [Lactuca saligna]|uniref:Uncharacterized protein n=1 Tax=Lactuca saligna TaxID=75948 RepID=A0AA35Z2A8_LACSI|nr:unnamed protein product [Lactuca saligna]